MSPCTPDPLLPIIIAFLGISLFACLLGWMGERSKRLNLQQRGQRFARRVALSRRAE